MHQDEEYVGDDEGGNGDVPPSRTNWLPDNEIGPRVYIVTRDKEGSSVVVSGPIALADDDELDEVMIDLLEDHPFEFDHIYELLEIDELGIPMLVSADKEWLTDLMVEAWADSEESDDETSDEEGDETGDTDGDAEARGDS